MENVCTLGLHLDEAFDDIRITSLVSDGLKGLIICENNKILINCLDIVNALHIRNCDRKHREGRKERNEVHGPVSNDCDMVK